MSDPDRLKANGVPPMTKYYGQQAMHFYREYVAEELGRFRERWAQEHRNHAANWARYLDQWNAPDETPVNKERARTELRAMGKEGWTPRWRHDATVRPWDPTEQECPNLDATPSTAWMLMVERYVSMVMMMEGAERLEDARKSPWIWRGRQADS